MMPTIDRHPSSYLLEHDGVRLLLDCGHTTVASLIQRGIDLHSLTGIAVTHFHTDHFGDVLPLIHARHVDDYMRQREHREFLLLGPTTLQERFRKLRDVYWPEPAEEYPICFTEFQEPWTPVIVGPFTLKPFPVRHVPWFPSVGYRVEAGGRSLVYPGDLGTDQGPEFPAALEQADALLIEAGALKPSPNHFTSEQGLELKTNHGIGRLILTHVAIQRLEPVRAFVDAHAPQGVILAEDGLEVEL